MFYQTLSADAREKLFAQMRAIDARSENYLDQSRKLAPRFNQIAVGGAHFEQFLKGEVLASYLRALRKGSTPNEALLAAQTNRTDCVKNWNKQRGNDYVVHRALDAEESLIWWAHRLVLGAVGASAN